MSRGLSGLVLDDSGVVGHHFSLVLGSVNYTLQYFGSKPISAAFLTAHFAMPDVFYHKFFPKLDAKKCVALHRQHLQESPMPRPLPGAVEGIKKLCATGRLMCVYSSHPKAKLVSEFENWGIIDCFTHIIGGADKCNSLPFVHMLKEFFPEYSRSNIYYVADTVDDARLAKNSRVSFVYIPSAFQRPREVKSFLLENKIEYRAFVSLNAMADSELSDIL